MTYLGNWLTRCTLCSSAVFLWCGRVAMRGVLESVTMSGWVLHVKYACKSIKLCGWLVLTRACLQDFIFLFFFLFFCSCFVVFFVLLSVGLCINLGHKSVSFRKPCLQITDIVTDRLFMSQDINGSTTGDTAKSTSVHCKIGQRSLIILSWNFARTS